VNGEPRGATYQRWYTGTDLQPRGGLIYDARSGSWQTSYVRWTLHHEFFHFIDETSILRERNTEAWKALNSRGFEYTGSMSYHLETLEHPSPGLITRYAEKSVEEDRAELFAALMTDEQRSRLQE